MLKHKNLVLLMGTILLILAITGGLFASAFLTDTANLGLEKNADFAKVEAASTPPSWRVFGSYTGNVIPGGLFNITPDTDWTGDMTCQITLANIPGLITAYRLLVLEVQVWDSGNTQVGTTEYLTLQKGTIDIEFGQTTSPYSVRIASGFYITNRGGWINGLEDPTFICQILQR